jgi:ParB-like chromosome segregation protein Spo0J
MILTVARLKDDYTQEEIGEKIGWSRSKVCDYSNLLNNIDAQVLDIARKHQKDRASKIDAHATFNFTAGY